MSTVSNGLVRVVDLNNAGQVAFIGMLAGTTGGSADDAGLFRGDGSGALTQVVREGQAASDGNGFFSSFPGGFEGHRVLNDAGTRGRSCVSPRCRRRHKGGPDVSFPGSSTEKDDDEGLFFFDDTLGLLQVVREGDALPGSTITSILFNGTFFADGDEDERNGFNERGQVVYRFNLADGRSGIALWSPTDTPPVPEPEPEPGAIVYLVYGLAGMIVVSLARPRKGRSHP